VFRPEASLSSVPFSVGGIGSNGLRKKVPVIHGEEESLCQGDQVNSFGYFNEYCDL